MGCSIKDKNLAHEAYLKAQLNDDFIFKKVMSNEEILKGFLERVMGIKISKLVEIVPGRELFQFAESHKIICDIYAKDDMGRVYMVEIQNYRIKSFINRLEYYSQLISADSYKTKLYPNRSDDYRSLPEVYCIWICSQNPFKSGHGIVNGTKVFFETNVSMFNFQRQIILSGDCIEDIKDVGIQDFLRLVYETTEENALHSSWYVIHLIYKEYVRIKHCKESEDKYMLDYFDQVYYETKGIKEGKKEGIKEGVLKKQKETIINMYHKEFDVDTIAEIVNCSVEEVKRVIDTLVVA